MFSINYIGCILSAPRPRVKLRARRPFAPLVLPVLLVLLVLFLLSSTSATSSTNLPHLATRHSSLVSPIPPPAPLTATDANGLSVTLAAQPQRILVAGKSAIIPSDALFLFPEARTHLLRLARVNQGLGNFYALLAPDLAASSAADALQNGGTEELAALRPDLVLAKTAATAAVLDPLRRLGIPGFALSLETPDEWLRELPELGRLLGEEARAAELVSLFRARLDAVQTAVSFVPTSARPRVLLLQASSADGILSFSVSPDDWLQTWMVETAGGIPVWKGTGLTSSGWSKVSFEQIAAWNPDAIYFVSYKTPLPPLLEAVKSDRRWQLLPAARNNRLRAMPADLVSWAQPVSRWILCLQWLAADLHPSAFPSFDPETALAAFYRDFYAVSPGPVLDALLSAYRASQP